MFGCKSTSLSFLLKYFVDTHHTLSTSVAPARGGQGRRLPPPNVEKDGPRNSSKFNEEIGMGVGIHLRCEKIINTKYF